MDFSDALRIIRSGWWVLVLGLLAGLAGGAAQTATATPKYQSTTQVYIAVQAGETNTASDLSQGTSAAQSKVRGYIPVITSEPVLEPVIRRYGLPMSAKALAANVSVASPKDSQLIDITVTSTNATNAARIANGIADSIDAVIVKDLEQPLADGSSPIKSTVLQRALPSTHAVDPKPTFNLALGAVLGIGAAIGIVFLRAMVDTRIRRADDVRSVTEAPVLGTILFNGEHEQRPLFVRDQPRGPLAEAVRDLRTDIAYLSEGGKMQTVMVTSAIQGEGKTTTSANLAIAMAESDARVLVIDADLRRPRVADVFGLEGAAGLSDVLVGRAEPADVVQAWGTDGLHVLPAGRIPPNPSELLGSHSMQMLMRQFESDYDFIVVDAPPLLPVTDAAVLSGVCGGAIIAASTKTGRKPQLRAAVERLEKIQGRVLGVVLTMMPLRRAKQEGYGGYGVYYGGAPGAAVVDDADHGGVVHDGAGTRPTAGRRRA